MKQGGNKRHMEQKRNRPDTPITICTLCGMPIERRKGAKKEMIEWELANRVHRTCAEEFDKIKQPLHISAIEAHEAYILALTQLMPEIENCESVMGLKTRQLAARKALENRFPFWAAQQLPLQQAPEEAKAEEAEEAEEAKEVENPDVAPKVETTKQDEKDRQ